ncbi:MAG: T9SS type A sorting domain-containing protein, partial [Sphingobacteriales bacterium]
ADEAGDTTGVSQFLPSFDLIGFPRILGTNVDRGGYEYIRAIYVDSAIAATGKGSSWADAYKYLSDATQSVRNVNSIDTIFVARGTYFPAAIRTVTNRDTAFIFTRSGSVLMGGYPNGGGTRDVLANPVVLSGDIGNVNDSTDNSYHVVVAVGAGTGAPLTTTLRFDGITITGGNANNATGTISVNSINVPRNFGGGMLNYYASPTLNNVTIRKNAAQSGAGMYNLSASPAMMNTTISANKATISGGGVFHNTSSASYDSVKVSGNISLGSGGGIATNSADLVISNSTIQDNKATTTGGGMHVNISTPAFTITNTLIEGNSSTTSGGGLYITNASNTDALVIANSKINRNTAGQNGGGIANVTASPTIRNTRISGNSASTNATYNGGGICNTTSSPVIVDAVITGNKAVNGAAITNSGISAAKIINTVIAGNNGVSGAAVYNVLAAAPVFRNCIITENNAGVFTSSAVPLPKPVFSYSIIQGSGGSGSGWVTATGIDSGFNKMANANFIQSTSFASAPDTSGNYSITMCSPAVNMGNATGVATLIPTLDMAGVSRYNGQIDAGAYEIDSLSPASMFIPTIGGIYTSNRTFQQGNLTHFCNCDSNRLLVTLDTFGTNVVLRDTSAKVRTGTAVAAYYQAGSGFVTNTDGTAIFNREWSVLPVVQPTSPVTVYTYYTDSDYVSVNNVMNSLMLTPLTSETQMYFYKVTDPSLGLFPAIFDIGTNQVHIITYGSSPSVNNWIAGTVGSNKFAQYKVPSFSGGGGGGSSAGATPMPNTPLASDILSFSGKKYPRYNSLDWEIAADITDWELSRSNDATNFKILAKGLAVTRNFRDEHPGSGINYYRLKVHSRTGRMAYSNVVTISNTTDNGTVVLYPVPATNSITIRCSNPAFVGKKITISDNVGRVIFSGEMQAESNVEISSWAAGMYHLTLPDGSSIKLVKE